MGLARTILPWQWLQGGQTTPKVVTMPSMWKRRWHVGETLFLRRSLTSGSEKKGENSCCQISGVLTPLQLATIQKIPAANSKLQISFQNLPSDWVCPAVSEREIARNPTSAEKKLQNFKEIDVKRFAKVEKIQGGELSDCKVPLRVIFVRIFWEKNPERELQLTLGVEKMELWMMFFREYLKFRLYHQTHLIEVLILSRLWSVCFSWSTMFITLWSWSGFFLCWSYSRYWMELCSTRISRTRGWEGRSPILELDGCTDPPKENPRFPWWNFEEVLILTHASGSMPESYTQRAGFLGHFESQMLSFHKTTHEQGCLARLPPGVQEGRKQLG